MLLLVLLTSSEQVYSSCTTLVTSSSQVLRFDSPDGLCVIECVFQVAARAQQDLQGS